jgi:xyloglucan-specific exo-beta-1,4-glucanase
MLRAWMRVVNHLFVCVIAASLAGEAPLVSAAGDYVWRNVKVGGGGFAPSIVFSRVERGLAYLRTDMGGAYRWDASARSWRPLEGSIAQSSYFGIESIAADPVDANVVYLAAGMYRRDGAAILRSRDRGKHVGCVSNEFSHGRQRGRSRIGGEVGD